MVDDLVVGAFFLKALALKKFSFRPANWIIFSFAIEYSLSTSSKFRYPLRTMLLSIAVANCLVSCSWAIKFFKDSKEAVEVGIKTFGNICKSKELAVSKELRVTFLFDGIVSEER